MSIGASLGITFFCQFFSVFEMFLNLERISCHTWRFFSAIFSKLFAKSEDLFEVNCFFPKWFCISFKSLWESNKKTFYFSVEKSMQVVQTAISISRAVFRGFFWQKKLKVCCAKQFRSSAESFVRIVKKAFNTSKGTICGNILLRKLLFCEIISDLEVWKFVFLWENRSKMSKPVPKNNLWKTLFWIRLNNWQSSDIFPYFPPKLPSGFVKLAI